jgi:hypothetical protein
MRPKKAERKDAYIIVRVSKAEHRRLKDLARQRGVSLSDLIRVALQQQWGGVESKKISLLGLQAMTGILAIPLVLHTNNTISIPY